MMPLLGAHVSIAGGLDNAPRRGEEIGCDAIQIFSKNQMRWKAEAISPKEAEDFKDALKKSRVKAVVIHDSYLINLGDPTDQQWKRSLEGFVDELNRAAMLGVHRLIFHPGSHLGKGEEFGIRRIAEGLDRAFENASSQKALAVLETTAGQGTNLGYTFEQLREIMDLVSNPRRVGMCVDTCHIFAAGYDIRNESSYEAVIDELDDVIGLNKVLAFHLNDSKKEYKSRVDRHEDIGKGAIGLDAFRFLLNDRRFKDTPMILETPGEEENYKRNLGTLRMLLN